MNYAISVELGDPGGDNDVLLEALSILGRRVDDEGGCQQWVAKTPMSIGQVRSFLMRHSRDEDRIRVVALPARARMLKHGEVSRDSSSVRDRTGS